MKYDYRFIDYMNLCCHLFFMFKIVDVIVNGVVDVVVVVVVVGGGGVGGGGGGVVFDDEEDSLGNFVEDYE